MRHTIILSHDHVNSTIVSHWVTVPCFNGNPNLQVDIDLWPWICYSSLGVVNLVAQPRDKMVRPPENGGQGLAQCWVNVVDVDPALSQPLANLASVGSKCKVVPLSRVVKKVFVSYAARWVWLSEGTGSGWLWKGCSQGGSTAGQGHQRRRTGCRITQPAICRRGWSGAE